jgi:dipeptidase
MCDTFVALPNHTASKQLIFGKNSDREPNEAQAIIRFPSRKCKESKLNCTYIQIPQVATTYEVILSKPFQMWGAEMGINEHGLVIGNEAVFTKIKFTKKNKGLTGMDLLRLALERCQTAIAARATICELLEKYGQDACGGYQDKNFFYHNSFLIADKNTAWVLETAGKHWAAREVKNFAAISNGLTIETDYDLLSKDAIAFAQKKGWLKKGQIFNFRKCYSDWFYTKMSSCQLRQNKSYQTGIQAATTFTISTALNILKNHNEGNQPFSPSKCNSSSICMHATGLTNPSQTTGSMLVVFNKNQTPTIWLTGTSMPCLSIYKPFFLGQNLLNTENWVLPSNRPDASLWWQAEKVHRMISKNYPKGSAIIRAEKEAFQAALFEKAILLNKQKADVDTLAKFSEEALNSYRELLKKWQETIRKANLKEMSYNPFYLRFQYKMNSF